MGSTRAERVEKSELDLMARLVGLELRERWGGWDRSPFTPSSSGHVSVYVRAKPQTWSSRFRYKNKARRSLTSARKA